MSSKKEQRLVLFDFDGTLTNRDSLFAFLKFFKGKWYFLNKFTLSLPILISYTLRILNGSEAKERLLSKFVKNVPETEFKNRCTIFGEEMVPKILNKSIVETFKQHIGNGDRVIIVSASIVDWIAPWANQFNVEVVSTKMKFENGVLTGTFDGKNCNGEEKVERIKAHVNLSDYNDIWAYGDSAGDEPMLALANYPVRLGKKRIS